jgi:hypothetical protein
MTSTTLNETAPPTASFHRHLALDISRYAPGDIFEQQRLIPQSESHYQAGPRCVVVLEART